MKNFSQRSCSVSTSSDDRGGEVAGQDGVEKMDQQSAVALGPEQGLEDAVDLGVDGVFHEQSLADGPTTDQTRRVPTNRGARVRNVSSGKHRGGAVFMLHFPWS
jgi:hypothetical protein